MATQLTPIYSISGKITDLSGEPVNDLIIHAFDQDPNTADNPLGETRTDEKGYYKIKYTKKDLSGTGHLTPYQTFRVYL